MAATATRVAYARQYFLPIKCIVIRMNTVSFLVFYTRENVNSVREILKLTYKKDRNYYKNLRRPLPPNLLSSIDNFKNGQKRYTCSHFDSEPYQMFEEWLRGCEITVTSFRFPFV